MSRKTPSVDNPVRPVGPPAADQPTSVALTGAPHSPPYTGPHVIPSSELPSYYNSLPPETPHGSDAAECRPWHSPTLSPSIGNAYPNPPYPHAPPGHCAAAPLHVIRYLEESDCSASTCLFVGQLPINIQDCVLHWLFRRFAHVTILRVEYLLKNGERKGCARVTVRLEEALRAIQCLHHRVEFREDGVLHSPSTDEFTFCRSYHPTLPRNPLVVEPFRGFGGRHAEAQ